MSHNWSRHLMLALAVGAVLVALGAPVLAWLPLLLLLACPLMMVVMMRMMMGEQASHSGQHGEGSQTTSPESPSSLERP